MRIYIHACRHTHKCKKNIPGYSRKAAALIGLNQHHQGNALYVQEEEEEENSSSSPPPPTFDSARVRVRAGVRHAKARASVRAVGGGCLCYFLYDT